MFSLLGRRVEELTFTPLTPAFSRYSPVCKNGRKNSGVRRHFLRKSYHFVSKIAILLISIFISGTYLFKASRFRALVTGGLELSPLGRL
jgi:hypothetical protein